MPKPFDLEALTSTISHVKSELRKIDGEEKIKQYGTFLDSKEEIVQLYILFLFFGVHADIIQQFPVTQHYDPD